MLVHQLGWFGLFVDFITQHMHFVRNQIYEYVYLRVCKSDSGTEWLMVNIFFSAAWWFAFNCIIIFAFFLIFYCDEKHLCFAIIFFPRSTDIYAPTYVFIYREPANICFIKFLVVCFIMALAVLINAAHKNIYTLFLVKCIVVNVSDKYSHIYF